MRLRPLPRQLVWRLRHPRTTVRGRLTLLYGSLFLASGIGLLAVTYALVQHELQTPKKISVGGVQISLLAGGKGKSVAYIEGTFRSNSGSVFQTHAPSSFPGAPSGSTGSSGSGASGSDASGSSGGSRSAEQSGPVGVRSVKAATLITQVRNSDLHQLLVESSIALAIMTVISAGLGWLVAGRVLRPLRTITNAAQQISEDNLHRRLALPGPRDELKDLSDTIDGLLGRLETAFSAQRNFVANASHELRTPLTVTRAMVQVALADPNLTLDTLRAVCEEVLDAGRQQEELIEALLTLARSQRGLERHEPLDLAAIVTEVVGTHEPAATARGLRLEVSSQPAPTTGDPQLLTRLVSNLVENAVYHNQPGGNLQVRLDTDTGLPRLRVTNTGPTIPADQIGRLLQPFQRYATDRVKTEHDGLGLGLSIVAAITGAHQAELRVRPGETGGLDVEVRFRRPPPPRHPADRDGKPPSLPRPEAAAPSPRPAPAS